jgi:sulfur carrier protein ThiS
VSASPDIAAAAGGRSIAVSVTLFASLRRRRPDVPDGPQRIELPAGATLGDLLAALGLEATTDVSAAVNGNLATHDARLPDGADIILMTPMEGGAAAEGEATASIDGRVPGPRATTLRGAAAEGEATSPMEGGL